MFENSVSVCPHSDDHVRWSPCLTTLCTPAREHEKDYSVYMFKLPRLFAPRLDDSELNWQKQTSQSWRLGNGDIYFLTLDYGILKDINRS